MAKFRFGKAFPDTLKKAAFKFGHFHSHTKENEAYDDLLLSGQFSKRDNPYIDNVVPPLSGPWRRLIFIIFLMVVFSILLIRLFNLQIIEGKNNRELADSNRIQTKVIHAPRGVIYDRNGKILAQNEPAFRLIGNTKIIRLSRDDALKMEIKGDSAFENLEIDSIRTYTKGAKMAHVLGYVSEITAEELKNPSYKNYKSGDLIGRGGIEEAYERVLRGIDGGEIIEVDAQGKKVRTLRKNDAIPGQNLFLTIDADLQDVAYSLLEEAIKKAGSCCGSLIGVEPLNGEVLTLVSYPSFDPQKVSEALDREDSPILNRVLAGVYPPGSTFKIVSALAGLVSGKITDKTRFEDIGIINIGSSSFSNWYFTQYGKLEGSMDIVKAFKRSNDTFFYLLGQTVGEEVLASTAKQLGLGKKTGIDIPGEAVGIVPDREWKMKNKGEIWYPGDTLHMSIGQGFVLATPLGINNLVSTIATDGKQFPPHLGLKITNSNSQTIKEFKFSESVLKAFKPKYLELVKEGLKEVTKEGGTAWPFFTFPIQTAGKTGTAEYGDAKGKTHAWYTSFAPIDEPKLVMTVLIEGGGEGSSVAAPVAKEIYRWFLSTDKTNLIKDTNYVASDSAKLGE